MSVPELSTALAKVLPPSTAFGRTPSGARHGASIVSINPLKERGLERFQDPQSPTEMMFNSATRISSMFVQPRLSGDLALIKAVAKRVVEGKAELGLTLSGEIASVPGAAIAGPLPPPLGNDTTYCAAVTVESAAKHAAAALIAALRKPETRDTWTKAGFEIP